jgi:ketosteroid isomerase-like protein
MSQENVEIVAAAASGRLDCWDADAELINFESAPYVKPYRGHQGLSDWYQDATEDVADADFTVSDFAAVDQDRVVSSVRLTGRAKGSGVPVDLEFALVWTVRGGKVIRAQGYRDRAEALEAVGLRE